MWLFKVNIATYPFEEGDRLWNEFKKKIEFYSTININAIMN